MTRNEFIAETAGRSINNYAMPAAGHVGVAIAIAEALEAANAAPWQTPPAPALTNTEAVSAIAAEIERLRKGPAQTDAARRVVETGIAWERDPGSLDLTQAHIDAVRAYKESAK